MYIYIYFFSFITLFSAGPFYIGLLLQSLRTNMESLEVHVSLRIVSANQCWLFNVEITSAHRSPHDVVVRLHAL